MVTKEKFQNMIFSLISMNIANLEFFGTHYYGVTIKNSKIKIENLCYGTKLNNKVCSDILRLFEWMLFIYKV